MMDTNHTGVTRNMPPPPKKMLLWAKIRRKYGYPFEKTTPPLTYP